ncbi:MAG TPA: alginate lyase family protein [Acidobacteriaceae bacterium]|nr:alginate lyase family protein [Acidobacteriaceae bacterium]
MQKNSIAISLLLLFAAAAVGQQPRTFLLNARTLMEIKAAPAADPARQHIVQLATEAGDRVLHDGPFSVMSKAVTPPSGDKHDYMSQAPYFWPDPSKPNGLPYIRHDGRRNPEIRKITDHDSLGQLGETSRALALAYFFTGKSVYSDRAALLLRTWFLDPATRMNPNLEFGQGIPGINTGRGIGIIETRSFMQVVDAIGLIQGSSAWTAADQQGMQEWFGKFVHWMRTSSKGQDESAAKNNHGTWYDLQLSDYALFLGDRDLAIATIRLAETKRIARQIEPDGRQPLELARTKAFSYSEGNLNGLMQLAELGAEVGVDLWNYRASNGGSIRAALNYLVPFALGQMPWPDQQIEGFHGDALAHDLEMAALAYRDPAYATAAQQLAGGREDFATALYRFTLAHKDLAADG